MLDIIDGCGVLILLNILPVIMADVHEAWVFASFAIITLNHVGNSFDIEVQATIHAVS